MKRVTGIGGVFQKVENHKEMVAWYERHLGIPVQEGSYALFWWRDDENPELRKSTTWSLFQHNTDYFGDAKNGSMVNYRVENLVELMKVLKQEGVRVEEKIEEYDYGKFGWIYDPEGNKIELWEPVDTPFTDSKASE